MCKAHVIRFIPRLSRRGSRADLHDVDLQMIYRAQGLVQTEFEGEGVHTFHAGSCWLQPRASSTRCSAIPTMRNCWRLCCRGIQDRDCSRSKLSYFLRMIYPKTGSQLFGIMR